MMMKRVEDVTTQDALDVCALFEEICRFGIEHQMDKAALAGIVAGYVKFLLDDKRPLEYFVNPKSPRGEINNVVVEGIKERIIKERPV